MKAFKKLSQIRKIALRLELLNARSRSGSFNTGSGLIARTEVQTKVPRYIRNDFGGSVGAPIIQDKTFSFGSLS
jgi:hypothetical protein